MWAPPSYLNLLFRPLFQIGNWLNLLEEWWYLQRHHGPKNMLTIGVVGDLSLQPPDRLDRVFASCCPQVDITIQVGDMHPGYDVVKKWESWCYSNNKKLLKVRGNHDVNWPDEWQRTWMFGVAQNSLCYIVGLDNANDKFEPSTWSILGSIPQDKPLIVVCHKPLTSILLSDGSESFHIMGEGSLPNDDAERLKTYLATMLGKQAVLLVHGHLHQWSQMLTDFGLCLTDGRGGAGGTGPGELGWTKVIVREDKKITLLRGDLT